MNRSREIRKTPQRKQAVKKCTDERRTRTKCPDKCKRMSSKSTNERNRRMESNTPTSRFNTNIKSPFPCNGQTKSIVTKTGWKRQTRAIETNEPRALRKQTDAERVRSNERMEQCASWPTNEIRTVSERRRCVNNDLKRAHLPLIPPLITFCYYWCMDVVCFHCDALKFKNKTPAMCFSNEKIELTLLQPSSEPWLSLISGTHVNSAHFLSKIRIHGQKYITIILCQRFAYKDKYIT